MPQYLPIMQKCPLFAGAEQAFLEKAVQRAALIRRSAGEVLLKEGADVRRLGVVLSGEAAVYKHTGSAPVLMSVLVPGDALGAATMFSEAAHAATEVRARKACQLMVFTEQDVKGMMQESFDFTLRYIAYLTDRVHFLTRRIASIGCTSAADKLFSYLVQNAAEGRVLLPTGMNGLADALSMSRASLYRVMDDLSEQGRLRREGRTIYVL